MHQPTTKILNKPDDKIDLLYNVHCDMLLNTTAYSKYYSPSMHVYSNVARK